MGRKAGHLALGIGKAAGATVTVIPEEFPAGAISLDDVCRVIEGAIVKRRSLGQDYGLAVVAEGVAARIDPARLAEIPGVEVGHDPHGNIRLEKIPLASILQGEIERGFAERGGSRSVVAVTLGYELRCAAPVPFDIDYTRTLGYGAVRFLLSDLPGHAGGGLVCLDNGRLRLLAFEDIQDRETDRIPARMVDVASDHYRVAREYMIRLRRGDFEDVAALQELANAAGMGRDEFVARFRPGVESDPLDESSVASAIPGTGA
jgi:6-phosphofructokinase 1